MGSVSAEPRTAAAFVAADGWSCLLLERRAGPSKYLFAPYGPTLNAADPLAVFAALKDYGRQQRADWLRLEPIGGNAVHLRQALKAAGGRPAAHEAEPHLTRLVDLARPEEDILASLSQTTRNIIRRNQRENSIGFKTSNDPEDIALFTQMLATVAQRQGVGFFSADYYLAQARALMPAGMMVLEIAYLADKPVATAIIHDFGRKSSYTYAASLPDYRDKNVSALLLWQSMINAKGRGSQLIDLYGIAPEDAGPRHPWAGFSAFKKKFGGQVVEYAGTWDLPLTNKYRIYRTAATAKKVLKRR
jgi:lipid II:glycine glycyltransferase (peptidoglycan interpeptide bridge formation enzyme)